MIAVNLIDPAVLAARRRNRRIRRWSSALIVALGVGAVPIGLEIAHERKVQTLRKRQNDIEAAIARTRTNLNNLRAETRMLESQVSQAEALRVKRPWAALLAHLSDEFPERMWLLSVATNPASPQHRAGARRAPVSKPDDQGDAGPVVLDAPRALVLEGYSLDQRNLYEFMSQLKGWKVFSDVIVTNAIEEPVFASSAVRFRLLCTW